MLQRQESATHVGMAGRISFRKLAQTYLSEILVSNFFSLYQTKFRCARGMRAAILATSVSTSLESIRSNQNSLKGERATTISVTPGDGTSVGFHDIA
ncbi:hypothetical protein [Burkholderia sp. S-53]|uniref:hypothetical protein n=1 Tax=Burkholderia sp. S-53 TaxID=2906514 RepID=UPI0021CF2832|nr:hypothetical protein [Burkholderia sp. S-53]UXU91871.1 hypothetical protein LXM88_27310 [Burkholderia sp. S-53]